MPRTRFGYYRRIFSAYLGGGRSQLSFWHEVPEASEGGSADLNSPYYMRFAGKAEYEGPFDEAGVPLLDYRGAIGLQYNPIAVAQYCLARLNRHLAGNPGDDLEAARTQADWLVDNLKPNESGVPVWMHEFDFEYRDTLRAPWYSGLAQGQGLSALSRVAAITGESRYTDAAKSAFKSLTTSVGEGGVIYKDEAGDTWIEEYLVDPPTHILNGFIWALWGVRDYRLLTGGRRAAELFDAGVATIVTNLDRFDTGYWSLYELSATGRLKMLASRYYHQLHIVQLRILGELAGRDEPLETAARWERYSSRRLNRTRSYIGKVAFKLLRY